MQLNAALGYKEPHMHVTEGHSSFLITIALEEAGLAVAWSVNNHKLPKVILL